MRSKWGLIGFAQTLAIELGGDNIRANAIAPGAVGGQRIESVLAGRAKAAGTGLDEARASMLAIQSIKHFVDLEEIAALCVYLASDAGKSISGQVIPDRQRCPPGVIVTVVASTAPNPLPPCGHSRGAALVLLAGVVVW